MSSSKEYKLAQELVQLASDVALKTLDCNNQSIKFDEQDLYRLRSARAALVTVRDDLGKRLKKGF